MTNQLFSIFKNNLRRQRKSAPGNSYSRSHRRGWPRSEESCHYCYHWLCSDTTNNFYLGDLGRNPRDFLQVWLRGGERNDREDNQQEPHIIVKISEQQLRMAGGGWVLGIYNNYNSADFRLTLVHSSQNSHILILNPLRHSERQLGLGLCLSGI